MFQIPKEYYDLFQMISTYKVDINKHSIPTYLMDAIEESVNEYNDQFENNDVNKIKINRRVQKHDSRAYELMSLHSKGEVTYYGENIKVPTGYKLVEDIKEETNDET